MAISNADVNESDPDESTEEIEGIEVIDSDLDESTKQTEGGEEAETSSHGFRNISLTSVLRMFRYCEDLVLNDPDLVLYDPETMESLREISGLYGDEILWLIFQVVRYHADEARRRLKLNSLPEELRMKLEKMAEAKAGVYALKEKLEVLFELFLYVCLILETTTSKQTRRSKEDKCIVYILLLRSGVESNPGPRTWIDDIPAMQMATTGDLKNLASCIGNGWRQLGPQLNVGEAKLDHIEHDNKTMQEKIYRMLQKSPFKDSLREILLILDDASNKSLVNVDWNDISDYLSKYGQEQPTIKRDVADAILARLATLENQMTTVQTTQAEHADLKNKVTCLQAENRELKTENASLKRGAQKRNAAEGETSTDVKKVKHQ